MERTVRPIAARLVLDVALSWLAAGVLLSLPLAAFAQAAVASAEAPPAEAAAAIETIPNEKCFRCHDDPEAEDDKGGSVAVIAAQFGAGAHKRLDCVTCHTSALTTKHPRNALGPVSFDSCVECHEDEITPFRDSVHARVRGAQPDVCQGCHGSVHTTPRSRDERAPMSAVNQLQNCGQCHQEMMEGYLASEHAHALLVSGLNSAPACSDCHGSHDIARHTDAGSRSSHQSSPQTCGSCHEGILKVWTDSVHGQLWKEGKDGPVCSTCHLAHAVKDPTTQRPASDMPHDCGNCHDDCIKTFHDSFHGKARAVGRRQAADLLRLPHAAPEPPGERPALVDPPGQPAGHLRRSACHADDTINASFLTFDPHSDPMDKARNPMVH